MTRCGLLAGGDECLSRLPRVRVIVTRLQVRVSECPPVGERGAGVRMMRRDVPVDDGAVMVAAVVLIGMHVLCGEQGQPDDADHCDERCGKPCGPQRKHP